MIPQRGSSLFPPSLVEDQKDIEAFPSPNSLLCPIIFNPSQDHRGGGSYDIEQLDKHQHHHFLELAKSYDSHGGSIPSSSLSSLEKDSDHEFKLSSLGEDKDSDQGVQGSPVGWMSSKMRFMMKYDQKQPSSSSSSPSNTENIRVCTDCNTTKTPLWRSGPKGPKSLCNACGIRQRKARRAIGMATAGTSTSTALLSAGSSSKPTKTHYTEKKPSKNHVAQCKKQSKLTPRRRMKLGFEEFIISLSNNSAFHQVFPQDETEAAILLMALSCGLVSD